MTGCGKAALCCKKVLMFVILVTCLAGLPVSTALAEAPSQESTQDLPALLAEQNRTLSLELRRIMREIAALRADLDKPGLQDVFSGIGYIFGLFGTAAFVASRRRNDNQKQ